MRSSNPKIKIAVYSLLLIIAIFLAYIEYNNQNSFQGFMLNLATEFMGAVFIFILIDFFFVDKDDEIYKKILGLQQKLNSQVFTIDPKKNDDPVFGLEQSILEAEYLDVVGYNLEGFLHHSKDALPKAIWNGLKVRLLTFDPDDPDNPAYQLAINAQYKKNEVISNESEAISNNNLRKSWIEMAGDRASAYLERIKETIQPKGGNSPKGKIVHKALNWIPSCSMIIFKFKDKPGKAKIVFNPPSEFRKESIHGKKFRILLDEETDLIEFRYYSDHFELLWNYLSQERIAPSWKIDN